MSNDVFPPAAIGTPRLAWSNVRAPEFRTLIEQSASGLETAAVKWLLPLWQAVCAGAHDLPRAAFIAPAANTLGAARHLARDLPAARMRRVLAAAPVYHAEIDDLLLTALAVALEGWCVDRGQPRCAPRLVALEGHGREAGDSGLDLTRTVGWFTSLAPVRLDLSGLDADEALASGPAAGMALQQVKEALREAGHPVR